MMIVVLGGLFLLDLYVVPASIWLDGFVGFFSFGYMPQGVDVLLLGALVGYSAYGGFGNNAITNWYRDKGYCMGEKVGYISTLIGGKAVHVSPVGRVAMPTETEYFEVEGVVEASKYRPVGCLLLWCDGRHVSSRDPLCCGASKGRNPSSLGDCSLFCKRSHLKVGNFRLVPRPLLWILDPVLHGHQQRGPCGSTVHGYVVVRIGEGSEKLQRWISGRSIIPYCLYLSPGV